MPQVQICLDREVLMVRRIGEGGGRGGALTATGKQTLRGEADRVELLDVDRWIGGTHITPDNLWRWDTTDLRLIRPSRR
jgi:hypothetical protein